MADWRCDICDSSDGYPMMLIKCGHSYCEACLICLDRCPACRMPFSKNDYQPNYALVRSTSPGGSSRQATRRDKSNLDSQLMDLTRKMQLHFESRSNKMIESIIEQINKQITDYPDRLTFQCRIERPTHPLLMMTKNRLNKYGISLIVSESVKRELILSDPPEITTTVIFTVNKSSAEHLSSTAATYPETPAINNLSTTLADLQTILPSFFANSTASYGVF